MTGVIFWYISLVWELVHSRGCLVSSVTGPSTLMLCGCVMLEVSIVVVYSCLYGPLCWPKWMSVHSVQVALSLSSSGNLAVDDRSHYNGNMCGVVRHTKLMYRVLL